MSCRRLHRALRVFAALLVLKAMPALAQMPTHDEFEAVLAAVQPEAKASGLSLRTANLWSLLVRTRVPLLARLAGRFCYVGYSAYTPGRDFTWLFPVLNPQDRPIWLQGLVHHELAHCVDAIRGPEASPAAGASAQHRREAYADLAFALHVDAHSQAADRLISTLADLRAQHAAGDPEHDTAAVLRCYLAHPMRATEPRPTAVDWAARLAVWQQRCWMEPAGSYAMR